MAPAPPLPIQLVIGLIFFWLTSAFRAVSQRVKFRSNSGWTMALLLFGVIVAPNLAMPQDGRADHLSAVLFTSIAGTFFGALRPTQQGSQQLKRPFPGFLLFLICLILGPLVGILFAWMFELSEWVNPLDRQNLYFVHGLIGLIAGAIVGFVIGAAQQSSAK